MEPHGPESASTTLSEMHGTKRPTRRRPLSEKWERFAQDAAAGTFTQRELAKTYQLSQTQISRILRGESRRPVARRIREILEHIRQSCLRLLGSRLQQAVATLVTQLTHKDARIAQSAAKKVLDLGLSADALLAGAGDEAAWDIPEGMWTGGDETGGDGSPPCEKV